ncbi:MAG: hypothetical protein ACE5NW_18580, partial [Acidiferrobacterales bacterium]
GANAHLTSIIVTFENLKPTSPEKDASGRVMVTTGHPLRGGPTFEIDIKNLVCRSGGLDPIDSQADQLGAAFYALYLTTVNEPRTRLHIFNTICSTENYKGDYNTSTYLQRTEQTENDIGRVSKFVEIG